MPWRVVLWSGRGETGWPPAAGRTYPPPSRRLLGATRGWGVFSRGNVVLTIYRKLNLICCANVYISVLLGTSISFF